MPDKDPRTASISLRRRLVAAYGSALLVLGVVWVGVEAIARVELAQGWVDHAYGVRSTAYVLAQRLMEADLARATYVVAGDPRLLDGARDLRTFVVGQHAQLLAMTHDNSSQQERLLAMWPYLDDEVSAVEETIRFADANDKSAVVSSVLASADRASFRRLDALLDAVRTEEGELIAQRQGMTVTRRNTARLMLLIGGGVAFLLATFVINNLRKGILVVERAREIIEKQASELRARGQQLERSMKELDQFAYVAAHDLRAPLRAISSLAEWIVEDSAEHLDDEGRERLQLMVARVARMEGLVQGVLEYSRAGRNEHQVEVFATGDVLRGVIDLLQPQETTVTIETAMPTVKAPRVPLQQIWMNLVSNAVKHGKKPGAVRVGARDEGGEMVYYVADDGPGIDPAYQEKIFVLFQTLEARDDVESTGIGLAVVKKLVEQQGGRVWVESEVGHGATFKFTYPAFYDAATVSVLAVKPRKGRSPAR